MQAGLWFDGIAGSVGIAAAVAVGRRPESRRMALLIGWWLAISLALDVLGELPDSRLAVTLLLPLLGLQAPAFAHMALAYPAGAVRDRPARAFLAVAYPFGLLSELPPALFADFRCTGCSPHVPSLLFTGTVHDLSAVGRGVSVTFIALGAVFLVLLARRLRGVPPGARRTLVPLAAAGVYASVQFIGYHAASLASWGDAFGVLDWLDRLNSLILPVSILYGLAAIRRGVLGDLVVELSGTGDVRAALARAVGDPSLELVAPTARGDLELRGRAVTPIGPDLAIVHDEALTGQRALLEAAGAAARLALDNARLRGAAVAERRRVERDLHDGAQQRLLALGLALQRGRVDDAQEQLRAALRELRELARGVHPSILFDRGLAAAIAGLVDRAPIPVSASVTGVRQPEAVESAAYFVVSEALANVAKHSGASRAHVSIEADGERLIVEVSDDGRGGADAAGGSGLRGLAERVGALRGTLSVETAAGAGTAIRAEIPCGSR